MFTARAKFFFNTPQVLARLGKWRHDILVRVGAYGRGAMRNKLGRPQRKQTRERTVAIDGYFPRKSGQVTRWTGTVFVPRRGRVMRISTKKPVPAAVAAYAVNVVSQRVKGQGAGKPPKRGPSGLLRQGVTFSLDDKTETVVIGVEPIAGKGNGLINAVSTGQLLDKGRARWLQHPARAAAGQPAVPARFSEHPFTQPSLPPTVRRLEQLIKNRRIGR